LVGALRQLLALQEVDSRIAALEAEAAALPARRSAVAEGVERVRERAAEARARLEAAELEERRLAGEVRDRETLIQRLEGQSGQVRTNDAYRALLHEIEQAREVISERETAILELMEAIDAARADARGGEGALRDTESKARDQEEALAKREEELRAELEAQRELRRERTSDLDASLLTLYERIAERHAPAVALVVGEVCQGCRTRIPPQLSLQILRAERVETCQRCRRILVHERVLAGPG
jgi:uncharacterized protein